MRLLVTGGSGFVLSNVVYDWLESDTAATCIVMDLARAWDATVRAFLAPYLDDGRLEFIEGSVSDKGIWGALGTDFTHIISGAAITPTRADEEAGAENIMAVNLFGCINALEFARSNPALHRFVFVSSDAVYEYPGLVRDLLPEEESPSTMGLYCLSKFAGENAVARWAELYGMDACCVRFADVYGRLDRNTGARNRHNAPYWVCEAVAAGEPVCVRGKLDDLGWDYVSSPDVAKALSALLRATSKPKLPVYVIGIGRPVAHRELLEAAFAAAPPKGASTNLSLEELVELGAVTTVAQDDPALPANDGGTVHLAALPRPHPLRVTSYNISPLLEEFGWKPRPFAEAVKDYMRWLLAHRTKRVIPAL
jgi:UDP-glucose 4-epimerase|eukprot:COSAG02_NODE_622_length_19435_cov_3.242398_10_plen_366_part_00